MKVRVGKIKFIGAFLLLAGASFSGLTLAKLPVIPFPDDVNVTVISEGMVVNGLPIMAYEYHTFLTQEELFRFYRTIWERNVDQSDNDHAYLETLLGEWRVLSRLELGHNITIQAMSDGIKGLRVLVGLSPLPKFLATNRKSGQVFNIPQLGKAKIISVVQSNEFGRELETYWVDSADTVEVSVNYYQKYYESKGYQVNRKRVANEHDVHSFAEFLQVNGKAESMRFDTIDSEGATRMVVNREAY